MQLFDMKLFDPHARETSREHERVYAAYEIAYTVVDFCAAMAFLAGSVLFFWDSTLYAGTWLFVIGSALFALKPTLRLLRELKFASMGDEKTLAERARGEI